MQYFVKTSGKHSYLQRAIFIAESWGREVDSVTFLFDSSNETALVDFSERYPFASVKTINGTEEQDEYKYKDGNHHTAFAAQRKKTRAVFEMFNQQFDWCCYMDDDMYVNHTNLLSELLQTKPLCQPSCFIGDGTCLYKICYTMGGWCMEAALVLKICHLFGNYTDRQLRWDGSDDMTFARVLSTQMQVRYLKSPLWFSEHSKPSISNGTFGKVSIWDKGYREAQDVSKLDFSLSNINSAFSVYHTKFLYHTAVP